MSKHKVEESYEQKTLLTSITLLQKDSEFLWVEFADIQKFLNSGYFIFNPIKRQIYESLEGKR